MRVSRPFESSLLDVRYALRGFRRNPGFVATVAATIALGLGINVALFTLFNAYVLRPVAVQDPYALYTFTWTTRAGRPHAFSWEEYQRLRENSRVFSQVAAVVPVQTRLDGRMFQGQLVTGNYFQMLSVGTALGRTLLPEDAAAPGRDSVVVISYEAWQTRFGGRPDIIGSQIVIHGSPMEIIGVARQGFQDLSEVPRDFWAPITVSHLVTQRTKEFGIRVALGATARTITALILNQSLRVAAAGVALGAALAAGLSRLMASHMVFMRVFDAQAFAAGPLLVVAATMAAGYIPSRRAARVDPMDTLRCE